MTPITLITGILLLASIQPTSDLRFCALTYALLVAAHEILFWDVGGFAYHGSAAAAYWLIVVITSKVSPSPRLVSSIQSICLVSVLVELTGYLMYEFYLEPTLYNYAYIAIFAWAIISLSARNGIDVGNHTIDSVRSKFRNAWRSYSANSIQDGAKT